MGNYTEFKSRKGIARCNDERFFRFITDMRNFDRFGGGSLQQWKTDATHCSFTIAPLGEVNAEMSSLTPSSKAVYSAETALTGKVSLDVMIEPIDTNQSAVTLTVGLELSPFLKIVMGAQVEDYLERLIEAIEAYDGYKL